MLLPEDRAPTAASGVGFAPAPPSATVPVDDTTSYAAPAATPVDAGPSRTELQGIGLHLDPTSAPPATGGDGGGDGGGITLGDLPIPISFVPADTGPLGPPSDGNPGAPAATPVVPMRSITPRDRATVNLIPSATPQATADSSHDVPPDPLLVGYTSQTPFIALVALAAVASLAWWLVKRGSLSL